MSSVWSLVSPQERSGLSLAYLLKCAHPSRKILHSTGRGADGAIGNGIVSGRTTVINNTAAFMVVVAAKRRTENATKMSKDKKLWRSNRPLLRFPPLSGGVAI